MSSRDAAFCLPGFEGLSAPRDLRLRAALVCPEPYSPSPVGRIERTILVNNLTVLFRLMLWHRKIRGHKRQPTILVDSWGVDTRDVSKIKMVLARFWQHVISARERYLEENPEDTPSRPLAGGDNDVGPVRVRIPGAATDAEARLAFIVDKLRADITEYGRYRQVSSFEIDRIKERTEAWDLLLLSAPLTLLERDPVVQQLNADMAETMNEKPSDGDLYQPLRFSGGESDAQHDNTTTTPGNTLVSVAAEPEIASEHETDVDSLFGPEPEAAPREDLAGPEPEITSGYETDGGDSLFVGPGPQSVPPLEADDLPISEADTVSGRDGNTPPEAAHQLPSSALDEFEKAAEYLQRGLQRFQNGDVSGYSPEAYMAMIQIRRGVAQYFKTLDSKNDDI